LKLIIVLAPRQSDFGDIAKFLDVTDAERFSGLYIPRYGVILAMGEAGTDALVTTLVHEAAHAFTHAGYGAAGMLWAIEGYAELLKRRHSVENGIQGAAEQYSAFLTMHAQSRTLSIDQVISVTESTHTRLDEIGCFCFEVFATALTAYLLDVRTTNTAPNRLWRRAIVKGFPSADAFARALGRSTGLSLSQLETEVIARLEQLRSDTGDAEIGWTEAIRGRHRS